jgi:DNA-binding HxlR family transcriptional regulator
MIPRASKKVLTQSLRELEASGIVLRKDLSDLVLHIEYELRPDLKENVSLLLEHVARWGEGYLSEQTESERTGEDQEELDFEAQSAAAGVETKREEKSARVSRIHRL